MFRGRLPLLDFKSVISATSARQDKIEIAVAHGVITAEAQDVESFLTQLGAPPTNTPSEERIAFGKIFRRRSRGVPPFKKQEIRIISTQSQPHPPPLFGGHLKVDRTQNVLETWRLSSVLSLNPTRFLRHQQLPSPRTMMSHEIPAFAYRLYHGDLDENNEEEFALIERDNWIPDSRFWGLFTSPRFWPRHLRNYLRKSVAEVRNDLRRAAELTTVPIASEVGNPFSLYTVETYFEFYSEFPIRTVQELQPLLDTYAAATVDAKPYPTPHAHGGCVGNDVVTVLSAIIPHRAAAEEISWACGDQIAGDSKGGKSSETGFTFS